MHVDEAFELIGAYGRFQIVVFILIGLNFMYTPMHIFSDVFTAYEPVHYCKPPPNKLVKDYVPLEKPGRNDTDNDTTPSFGKYSSLRDHDEYHHHGLYKQCRMYKDPANKTETTGCLYGIHYEAETEVSIVTEWSLSCDNDKTAITITVHGVAAIIGAVIFSPFADRYGRKALLVMCWWQTGLLALGMVFVGDVASFWVLRFLSRLYTEGAELAMFILACEFFPTNQRPFAAYALYLFYGTGHMLLAAQAYFIYNWRILQLAITLGIWILLPFTIFFLPESPHWLATWGDVDKAEKIFHKAARFNKVVLPSNFRINRPNEGAHGHAHDKHSHDDGNVRQSVIDMGGSSLHVGEYSQHELHAHLGHLHHLFEYMQNSTLRRDFLIPSFMWMMSGYLYTSLTVTPVHLGIEHGDYLMYFLSGLVTIPAFSSIFLLRKYGRTKPIVAFFVIAGVFMMAYSAMPTKTSGGTNLAIIIVVLKLTAKYGTTAALAGTRLIVAEIFPTTVRSTCVGLTAFIGFCGASAGLYHPLIKKKWKYVGVAAGALGCLAALLASWLPDTSHRPLPESIKEMMMSYKDVFQNMVLQQMNAQGISTEKPNKGRDSKVAGPANGEQQLTGVTNGGRRNDTVSPDIDFPKVQLRNHNYGGRRNEGYMHEGENTTL